MTTARDIVNRALEHLNVLGLGQTASAEDADVGLRALAELLDQMQLDPQMVIGLQEYVYSPPGGTASFTIGPTGQVSATTMPARLELSSFYRVNGVDKPVGIANSLDEYNSQPSKTSQGLPLFIAYNRNDSTLNGTVYLSPASNGTYELHLWARQDVVAGYQSLTLSTSLTLPNGFKRTLGWILAEELLIDYTIDPSTAVMIRQMAANARRKIKQSNYVSGQLQMPVGVIPRRFYNITTG